MRDTRQGEHILSTGDEIAKTVSLMYDVVVVVEIAELPVAATEARAWRGTWRLIEESRSLNDG